MKLPNDEYANLDVTDAQMLRLIPILKANGLIRFQQEFCDAVGLLKQNIRNIKIKSITGPQHFTAAHILNACKEYNVNANWIMGLEKEVFRGLRYRPDNSENLLDKIGQNGVGARAKVKPAANTGANKRAQKSNI